MTRLLGILAEESVVFGRCFPSLRQSSPSIPDEHLAVWTRGAYGSEESWALTGGSAARGEALLPRLLETSGRALIVGMEPRANHRETPVAVSAGWCLGSVGRVEDTAYLTSRIRSERAGPGTAHASRLLAFILSRLDEAGVTGGRSEGIEAQRDAVLAAATSEIGQRIGSISFLLSNGSTLFAYRFDRSLFFRERDATAHAPASILIASEALTNEGWVTLEDRALLRCRWTRGGLSVAFLAGRDPRPRLDVELPFTD